MKHSALALALVVCVASHAEERFETGQAARAMIGQKTFTDQQPGSTSELIGSISGLAYANNTLFVADSNRIGASPLNHRVLIFNNLNSFLPAKQDELYFTRPCPVCVGQATVVLGQPDFEKNELGIGQNKLRLPTAVATDGTRLAVADTDNNRVLIWNSIPGTNQANANLVVGQPDFTKASIPPNNTPTAQSMRGPQGVWIQDGRLFVADTQNHRVLIWNRIPTSNGQAADVVLGQPNFTSFVEPDLTRAPLNAAANTLLNPVAVTSDGQRLFVTDLGYNRVLVWNSIPTRNQQPADFALGQPDLTSAVANNSSKLCESNGTDDKGNATYPDRCLATMDFPRFALSDGQRVFVADGGNDRVLIYDKMPTQSGQAATYVIGQLGGQINQASDSTDSMRTPMSLAWDGTNLYVADTYNRRILVYSVAEPNVPYTGVRNAASIEIFAVGGLSFGGELKKDDEITITIGPDEDTDKEYKYKIVTDETFETLIRKITDLINAGTGDRWVLATPNVASRAIILTSRVPGSDGNNTDYSVKTSDNAVVTVATAGAQLAGGQDAAKIAPGTNVSIIGDNLSSRIEEVNPSLDQLPGTLADTQVYFDGIAAPLFFVSPTQINAQIPYEVRDRTSTNVWVRSKRPDGSVMVTVPRAVTIVPQNPGIFTHPSTTEPRPAVMVHGSAFATGTVSVDGSAVAGDVAIVVIEDREYKYTVVPGDTTTSIRDKLIELINEDPRVIATPSGTFQRIRLRARVEGPEGTGISFSARATTGSGGDGASVIMTAFNSQLCCANSGLVTESNPAAPGETIILYATGLGLASPRTEVTGKKYDGPVTDPLEFVSSLAGGKTANVLLATMQPGTVGVYEVHLELNSDMPTNPLTQLTIAQDVYVSNIVTFPLFNPRPSQ